MRDIIAYNLITSAGHLEKLAALMDEWENPVQSQYSGENPLNIALRRNISVTYDEIAKAAEALGAPVTKLAAERAKKRLLARKTPLKFKELKLITGDVKSRFEDELGSVRFYCLNKGADEFYSPSAPLFGEEVDARISKANDDVSEAGKCFAVGRYTASVFHLMRAMEAAVQRLSEQLGIKNVEREWGKLLSDIHGKIEEMPKGDARDDWSLVHANLYHVKQAWRNDTMHPKATYTEEEAREVFDAMKAFMRHLALMLPPSLEEVMS